VNHFIDSAVMVRYDHMILLRHPLPAQTGIFRCVYLRRTRQRTTNNETLITITSSCHGRHSWNYNERYNPLLKVDTCFDRKLFPEERVFLVCPHCFSTRLRYE